jgi:flagellar motor component MotA
VKSAALKSRRKQEDILMTSMFAMLAMSEGKMTLKTLKKIREISKENKRISKEDVLFMIWELEQKIFKKYEEDLK